MQATESSTDPQRRQSRRSKPPPSADTAPRFDGESAGVVGAYLDVFGRPPLGDHPEMDGFATGRVLAEKYPEAMMQVMEGFREGVKAGTKAADRAGGQDR